MANKVSIFITNTKGTHFELTNSKMALMMACETSTNWAAVFSEPIGSYDIILSDFSNSKATSFGLGYSLIEHCNDKEIAEKIIRDCRLKLKQQYERMMEIRVAKKYNLNPKILLKIELGYHDSENYEINLKDYIH